ncbi:serpin B6-like [Ambystoma mexicanum]|uniref:serpin B6-like n=1 Tax=Ambystoma mexicanum TaxID=8296 RepID=UPI0037E88880
MDPVVVANTNFALGLYKSICESHKQENVFFSPWSISSALAMVYLGTKGNTAAQMAQVLQFAAVTGTGDCSKKARKETDFEKDNIHYGFQELISAINRPSSTYLLKTANRIFGEATYNFLSDYSRLVEKFYNAKQQSVNFIGAAEETRKDINAWVESQTENKIQNLLPLGSIDSMTRLVLVNAIYFKGSWAKKFREQNSQERPFRVSKTQSKPAQMMFQRGKFQVSYIDELMTKVLELPYVDNDLNMVILLPDDINDDSTGLEQLEAELSFEKFAKWTNAERMKKSEVAVKLPRFKLEEKYNLKSILSSMGMSDVFIEGKADLTGMSARSDLFLSQVFHQAMVEVNEEGTEAAASTAGVASVRSGLMVVNFEADHPFLFFIRHNKTGAILFYGRFCSP